MTERGPGFQNTKTGAPAFLSIGGFWNVRGEGTKTAAFSTKTQENAPFDRSICYHNFYEYSPLQALNTTKINAGRTLRTWRLWEKGKRK